MLGDRTHGLFKARVATRFVSRRVLVTTGYNAATTLVFLILILFLLLLLLLLLLLKVFLKVVVKAIPVAAAI
jgi:hypothetical protein